ncbi:Diacetylchitobiose binding protein DasA [Propionicimonas sp. T2.31MG-18]|uniref:extracellular solute-binding protein n=1 Tax=Propionicimonas sp. T2.31MG-18 TaxID=3157620 RepID=UPI0035E4BB2E
MKKMLSALTLVTASAIALAGCSSGTASSPTAAASASSAAPQNITLWLAGGDTPQELRDYLKTTYNAKTGGTLTIEEQSWGDLVTKLTTALPDPNNTPDVVEVGNTQSPTFTNVGAFADISDMYTELGGDKLLPSFVEVGKVDGKNYTLPYYFGSRYMFYRKDVYKAAGVEVPKTLDEFNATVKTIAEKNPKNIKDFSGFFIGGQDWRNGISWIFANGGDLAKQENGQWVSTLSDPNSIKGLTQLQEIQKVASRAPKTAKDESPWLYINDADKIMDGDKVAGKTSLAAATIMAPGWAHWSIGDLVKKDGKEVREWNPDTFGVYPLPGNDGKPAPVFAGGSNIGISAASKNQAGARELMKIIFSSEYQQMLGKNGLGPANSDYVSSMGSDEFAKALIDSASNSKLTPAAPGWAGVEASGKLEEFFSKVADGGDITALAAEYDALLTPMLNAK